jgi:hypothetical protein
MAGDKNIERVWAIVDKAGICMLTTRFDDCWKRPAKDHDAIWFLIDVCGFKDDEVEANPEV